MIELDDITAAAELIRQHVRRTPTVLASQLRTPVAAGAELTLKLELLQVTGSFKARGALNKLLSSRPADLKRGIVTASGGNHGIATALAGRQAGVSTTVFLPTNASPAKVEKIRAWGAEVRIEGSAWHQSDLAAREFAATTGACYFHPFADPLVAAGQGTVALEIIDQCPGVETVLIAIGGGGLISGMATALKARAPQVRVIGIEAAGSPVLLRSLEAGRNVKLDAVTTQVATMACAHTDDRIFELVRDRVDAVVLVDDDEMRRAARWLWFEMGLAADLSGAAAIAALMEGRVHFRPNERICAVVCGAGPDAILPA
ncbi:MAG: threonine/serine dehydratase [Devosia sp.]